MPAYLDIPPEGPVAHKGRSSLPAARQRPHLRRFILLALATGTRHSAILSLRWAMSLDTGWVDTKAGIIHRRGERERITKKRRGRALPW